MSTRRHRPLRADLPLPARARAVGIGRILKLMNRGYSLGQYLEFIDRAQARIPDVSIAGT